MQSPVKACALTASLGEVGLASGGLFFAAALAAKLTGPSIGGRIGAANGARTACLCCGAGNLVCALAPSIGVLLAGRLVAGFGLGLAFLIGPAIARTLGGVRMVGVFGAALMGGIGVALGGVVALPKREVGLVGGAAELRVFVVFKVCVGADGSAVRVA